MWRWMLQVAVLSLTLPTPVGALGPGGTFVDDDGMIHEGAIEAVAAAGITSGCTTDGGYFCPRAPVTRGQMAAFLHRGFPIGASLADAFGDDDGSVFEADLNALAAAGVLRGCDPPANHNACPDDEVSRAQMASMLVRVASLAPSEADPFADDDASVHAADIAALAQAGVTVGCNPPANDLFCPDQPVTRAEMASFLSRALYLTPIVPPPPIVTLGSSCIDARSPTRPTGSYLVAAGESAVFGQGDRLVTFSVEVEEGLPVDLECFARVVELTLGDPRSWIAGGELAVQRVDGGSPDVRVTLASPTTVDSECLPLNTAGIYSCWTGARAMINLTRWTDGASDFGDDMTTYRIYVINHEVGHGLDRGHIGCARAGEPAPVMMQQTKSTGSCLPNGWPTPAELR